MFSRAKSFRGLIGNIKYLIQYKTWSALVIFLVGICIGLALTPLVC